MVERTDDHPGTGSATYCSAVSLRQVSWTLALAQRSYANNATTSSCMRISPGPGQGNCRNRREVKRDDRRRDLVRHSVSHLTPDTDLKCHPFFPRTGNETSQPAQLTA